MIASHTRHPGARLVLDWLEDRLTPSNPVAVNQPRLTAESEGPYVTLNNADGTTRFTVEAYGPFNTIRAAVGDVDGDGTPDLITVPGPGILPEVRVFSGTDGHPLGNFMAFELSFTGGMYVAASDLDGDGKAEIVVSPDQSGGPRVRVLGGTNGERVLADFFGIDDPQFRGGARVALGDVTGDGTPDLVVAAGFGGGPRVTVYDGSIIALGATPIFGGGTPGVGGQLANFFAFEQSLRNGVYVAAGDLNGDGFADLVFGGGPGGGPRVMAWDGHQLVTTGPIIPSVLLNFFAFDASTRDGVWVAVGDGNGDGWGDVFASQVSTFTQPVVFSGPTFNSIFGQPIGQPIGPAACTLLVSELLPPLSRPTTVPPIGNPLNTPPHLSSLADHTLLPDSELNISFEVSDTETPANQLTVTAASSDPSFLSDLHVDGTGAIRTLVAQPAAGRTGSVRITVTVTDGAGLSTSGVFTLTVSGSGQPPPPPPAGNVDYDNYWVISNVKGPGTAIYTGNYESQVDVYDTPLVATAYNSVRVNVTLYIDQMTPDDPNSDPATSLFPTFTLSGSIHIEVFRPSTGFLNPPITVPITGTYTLETFSTRFENQTGAMSIRDQAMHESWTDEYVEGGRWDVSNNQIVSTSIGGGSGLYYTSVGFIAHTVGAYESDQVVSNFILTRG